MVSYQFSFIDIDEQIDNSSSQEESVQYIDIGVQTIESFRRPTVIKTIHEEETQEFNSSNDSQSDVQDDENFENDNFIALSKIHNQGVIKDKYTDYDQLTINSNESYLNSKFKIKKSNSVNNRIKEAHKILTSLEMVSAFATLKILLLFN